MGTARYILGSINLINIILTGTLVFFLNYLPLPFSDKGVQYSLPTFEKHQQIAPDGENRPGQQKAPSSLDYVIVTEQNLFHPERKIPVEKEAAKPLPKPDFVLFGTFISDDLKIAYMKDMKLPYSTQGRGERQVALHAGETMSGYTVRDIYNDKVVMIKGDDRIEISVLDPARLKTRTASGAVAPEASEKTASRQKQPATRTSAKREDRLLRETHENTKGQKQIRPAVND